MNLYKKFLLSTFSNVILKSFVLALAFFVIPLFIEKMGKELYGIWILNFTIIGYFAIVVSGIPGGIIKHISESKGKGEKQIQIINVGFISYFLLGLLLGTSIFFFAEFILQLFNISIQYYELSVRLLKIAAIFLIALWPFSVFDSILKGLLEYKTLSIIKGVTAIINSAMILFALIIGLHITLILILSYTITLLSSLMLFVTVKKKIVGLNISLKQFDKKLFKSITRFTIGMLIIELISLMTYQVDQLIIGHYLSVSEITTYFIVTIIFYKLRAIYSMMSEVIMPVVFEANSKQDNKLIRKMAIKGSKYINIGFVPLVVLSVVISKSFITLWMGPEYGKYGYWSSLFVFQLFLGAVYVGVPGKISIGMGKLKQIQLISSILVILNIVISIACIPYFGFAGVLIGSVSSSMISVFGVSKFYCNLIEVPLKDILKANIKITIALFTYMVLGFFIIQLLIMEWLTLVVFIILFLGLMYLTMYVFFVEDKEKQIINNKIINLLISFSNRN